MDEGDKSINGGEESFGHELIGGHIGGDNESIGTSSMRIIWSIS